jgi:excinuclease ABC subunit A
VWFSFQFQGLDLARPAGSLSGGELQRIRLAAQVGSGLTGVLYVLDEPTTGLHFADIEKLLHVLERLVDAGNTVLVIEHNLEVIQAADWVLDMGPEAGAGGGRIVAEGPPEDLVIHARRWRQQADRDGAGDLLRSHTGAALEAFAAAPPPPSVPSAPSARRAAARSRSRPAGPSTGESQGRGS